LPGEIFRMKFNVTPIGTPRASGIGGMISVLASNFLDLPISRDRFFR